MYTRFVLCSETPGRALTVELLMGQCISFSRWQKWESNLGLCHLRVERGTYSASCQNLCVSLSNLQAVLVMDIRVGCKRTN